MRWRCASWCFAVSLFHTPVWGIDEHAMVGHVDQKDIDNGRWSAHQLLVAGERLFSAHFTIHDGAGRPGATGNPSPTRRPLSTGVPFIRTAGPDANSCRGCHNDPYVGAAGDFVTEVFAGTTSREPLLLTIDPAFVAERGTTSMNGSGAIEMLAREMTQTLHAIRADAIRLAKERHKPVQLPLLAKGVSFGRISAEPDGTVSLREVDGIDKDLVVRPWSQKGVVTSLRTFSVNAMNQHHGMEARERFGVGQTGDLDFDRDGVPDELTEGDITALVLFQAGLSVPGRVIPRDSAARARVARGEKMFASAGCASCHVPSMELTDPVFTEPGPYNLEGTLRAQESAAVFKFDLAKDAMPPHLERLPSGHAMVHAFTDLKRHAICDADRPFYCDEQLVQGFAETDHFLTKRLWDVGNTPPYGHRGDLTTIREAILQHGGEANDSQLAFVALSREEQDAIVAFLQTLQILPPGSPAVIDEAVLEALPYSRGTVEEKP